MVYTEFRPTPLQHFIFPAGGEGVYLIVDEKGKFREDNFQKALASLQNADQDAALAAKGGNKKQAAKGDCRSSPFVFFVLCRPLVCIF